MIWTEEELSIIKTKYKNTSNKDLSILLPNRNYYSLINIARKLGIKKELKLIKWTEEELNILKKNYNIKNKHELQILLPNKKWRSISTTLNTLRLKRDEDFKWKQLRRSKLEILLEEDLKTYYWIGFLLADGYLSNKFLDIHISEIDLDHLNKFKMHIKNIGLVSYKKHNDINLRIHNKDIIQKIREKFDFKLRKTYNPPDIKYYYKFTLNQLLAIFIGFIDGDGNIEVLKKCPRIRVRCHISWNQWLKFFMSCFENIQKIRYTFHIIEPKEGTKHSQQTYLYLGDRYFIKFLVDFIHKNSIPVLIRKWNKLEELSHFA